MDRCDCARIEKIHRFSYSNGSNSQTKRSWLLVLRQYVLDINLFEVNDTWQFYLILKFLHFDNNNDPPYDANDENRDRLYRLRPFLEMAHDWCKQVYQPGRCLSADESLVLFKGRLHFKQYIRTKRAHFGIKLYELTTSNGITLDLLVYCGKGMFYNDDEHSDMRTTKRIPFVLMEPFWIKDIFYLPTITPLVCPWQHIYWKIQCTCVEQ